ncbi:MAG: helix-turn-helix transcriptional regulator [Defluviitaleaceae bacterium]|nr:helix-turn-helix transcriptional regulator [Defluviitaleaceae bacterium]MCL2273532.1 helix-turn-helix transcriptional regulator [Defluviitaleaceae bacterium]
MSIMNYSNYIETLRQRKGMSQADFAEELGIHSVTQSRVEAGGYMLARKKSATNALIYAHLENQNLDVLAKRHYIITALDKGEIGEVDSLLAEMEALPTFETPINKQFIFSQRACVWEQQGHDAAKIMPLIKEGLQQTFFDLEKINLKKSALLFEEPELLHTLARIYAKLNNTTEAMHILQALGANLTRYNASDKDSERKTVPILHSLAKIQLQAQLYDDAIHTCKQGFHYSATRHHGLHAPDFLFMQAQAQHALQVGGCALLLRNAYFCYTMLHKRKDAEAVRTWARDKADIIINTYGVDKLACPPRVFKPYAWGALAPYTTMGHMIKTLREKAGYTLKQLTQGICSPPTLHRIENDEIINNIQYLEPIMQRLGRDAYLLAPYFLKQEDFLNLQMKENIHMLCTVGDYKKAAELLNILKTKKGWQSHTNLQFIKRVELTFFIIDQNEPLPDTLIKILDTLHITCPKFNENHIARYPLTHDETVLIDMLAGYYTDIKDYNRAAKIYERLLNNMRNTYEDETEKARMYASVLFNYSRCLGRMGRRFDALGIVQEGIDFERDRERLTVLPGLLFNNACNLYELGKKEESLPYFAQAYYGVTTFVNYGRAEHQKISQRVAMERFSFTFD